MTASPALQFSKTGYGDDILDQFVVVKRDGASTSFNREKISVAIAKAYLAVHGELDADVRTAIERVTDLVIHSIISSRSCGGSVHIELIQDQVEMALMREGHHAVARAYIVYRQRRNEERRQEHPEVGAQVRHVVTHKGREPLDEFALRRVVNSACARHPGTNPQKVLHQALRDIYDGVPLAEVDRALVLAARSLIETNPGYSRVASELLMRTLRHEAALAVLGTADGCHDDGFYGVYFRPYLEIAIKHELLAAELLDGRFDVAALAAALDHSRDLRFDYLGIQTVYDRYLQHWQGKRLELPQAMFMRIAMGLALEERNATARAIEFYELLSNFDFMSSTPTLFNSGTRRSQLSSCYLTTVQDDLHGIFEAIQDNAMLSKFAGGLGNDWTNIRAMGSWIKGTNGKSQGVVPFLKVANDTAVAVNQGGKRLGAVCAYLETWHLDIEEFLELRKNTGDDRRRTHDMNTANWIPDLFMKRVVEGGQWTLFSPADVPDLHDKFGRDFEQAYVAYEAAAERGEIKLHRKMAAQTLWRKMLTMLFETGHPWVTFKDAANVRSPQQHVGVVHSSNLCTEITLNTSADEIAVCNLGSVNLLAHVKDGALDMVKLRKTISTAMRMLDNVIDINYYSVDKARNSNLRHRPVGLGIMGFQDLLHELKIAYASQEALDLADVSMEAVCYFAYWASADLASERGAYPSFQGSLWSKGILPLDSLKLLAEERGGHLEVDLHSRLDWDALRQHILRNGMRNSNCVAIAPTATIANITGVSASIEPTFQNLFVKSNLSGEFTMVNEYLFRDLSEAGLWDGVMVQDIKQHDGSVQPITRISDALKRQYATAFEMDPRWLIEAASRRQKWIDQAQSLNLYVARANGRQLDEMYRLAWQRGLKTTYYLRTMAATSAEKSTGKGGELNAVSSAMEAPAPMPEAKFCSIDNPTCTACE